MRFRGPLGRALRPSCDSFRAAAQQRRFAWPVGGQAAVVAAKLAITMRDLFLELIAGLALVAIGFGVLWMFAGEGVLDYSGTTAWVVGAVVVGSGGVGDLATREALRKRRESAARRSK